MGSYADSTKLTGKAKGGGAQCSHQSGAAALTHSSRCPLSLVAGLHPAEERDTVTGLSLQLPVADQLGNELGLLVQANAADDPIKPVMEKGVYRRR